MKTLQQFLNDLGARESGGNYKAFNCYGYAGKYQMGEAALVDAGYYQKPSRRFNNDWSGNFLGKDGVKSIQDFLNNPKAQENAQRIFKKRQWGYLMNGGIEKYINKEIKGHRMTPSGLLVGAHLCGHEKVMNYVRSDGVHNAKDGNGVTVESYIRKFNGFDVSDITGIPNDFNLEN